MLIEDPVAAPVLKVRREGPRFVAEGPLEAAFGQKVPAADGGKPDGAYAGWRFDAERGVAVETDGMGLYPLHYALTPGGIMLSPTVAALLAAGAPRELDFDSLSMIALCGHLLDDDTPFKGIRRVPGDGTVSWNGAAFEVTGRFPAYPAHGLSRDDMVDAFIAAIRDCMRRRLALSDRPLLPLSGGRDSRMMGLIMRDLGVRPVRVLTTWPPPPRYRDDLTVATDVARRLGFPHEVVPMEQDFLGLLLRSLPQLNYTTVEHAWIGNLRDALAGDPGQLFDGLAGGVLMNGREQTEDAQEALARGPDALFDFWMQRKVITRMGVEGLQRALGPDFRGRITLDAARARFVRTIRDLARHPNPLWRLVNMVRNRRGIGEVPYGIHANRVVFTPFVDRSILALVAGAPPIYFKGRRLRDTVTKRAFPDFADVPYESGQNAYGNFVPSYHRRFARGALRLLATERSPLIDKAFVLPRLVQYAVHGDVRRVGWWNPHVLILLHVLGRVAD